MWGSGGGNSASSNAEAETTKQRAPMEENLKRMPTIDGDYALGTAASQTAARIAERYTAAARTAADLAERYRDPVSKLKEDQAQWRRKHDALVRKKARGVQGLTREVQVVEEPRVAPDQAEVV